MANTNARRRSGAVFNNDKWIEVVLALDSFTGNPVAQEIARGLRINHDLVTKVLTRLQAVDLVKSLARTTGSTRGPLPWEVQRGPDWDLMVSLCRHLAH